VPDGFVGPGAGDRLAEHDAVALDETAALRAGKDIAVACEALQGPVGAKEAEAAAEAAELVAVAVDLHQLCGPGGQVEAVKVLGNGHARDTHAFQGDQGVVAGVWAGVLEGVGELGPGAFHGGLGLLAPVGRGILEEALEAVHGKLAEAGPHAARTAEGRDAALYGAACADEGDDVVGAGDQAGGAAGFVR